MLPGAGHVTPACRTPRWWAFEDGRTNFGAVTPDTTDLAKLLFLEFALVYANDWFLLPCDLAGRHARHGRGLAVTDVFGERTWIERGRPGADEDWQRWAMFSLDVADRRRGTGLFLPPTVPKVAEGPPLEDVLLIRDEMANMVWGIERTSCRSPPATACAATRRPRDARAPAPARTRRSPRRHRPRRSPTRSMSTVPENWIPFIPVHVPGDNREIQLQRAAMPRILDGGPTPPARSGRAPRCSARAWTATRPTRTSCTRRRCRAPAPG